MSARTWAEATRTLAQLLSVASHHDEAAAMRGFLWYARAAELEGRSEERMTDVYEQLLSEHEARVWRALGAV